MRFSQRSAFDATENPVTRAVREARRRGRAIIDLTESNPTRAGLPYDRRAILGPLDHPEALGYAPEPFGTRAAREAVAETFGVDPERVVLTASTSEAYAMLLTVLSDPGDRVLSPEPSYPLLGHLAKLGGVALTPYALRWDGRWHVDASTVRAGALLGARAILAVSPNNPTGSLLDDDDLAVLTDVGLPVVVDEVFGAYPLEGETRSAYALDAQRIVIGGLSKLAGLPQMKVGWMLIGGDDTFAGALLSRLELVLDAFLSLGTPAQLALPHWLSGRGRIVDAIRDRTRNNLHALRGMIDEASPITVPRVEAGWYVPFRVPRTRTDEQWTLRLLEADDVLVQPGYFYDFAEDGWLVVSLLTVEKQFREGTKRLLARIGEEA